MKTYRDVTTGQLVVKLPADFQEPYGVCWCRTCQGRVGMRDHLRLILVRDQTANCNWVMRVVVCHWPDITYPEETHVTSAEAQTIERWLTLFKLGELHG